MNFSELVSFLKKIGKNPSKRLSQNFLVDQNILRKIIKTAQLQPQEWVLEIGPGPGGLTQLILEQGAFLVAVEKDTCFAQQLSRFQTTDQRLQIHCLDVLKFDFSSLPKPIKLIANLPYHITTPILEKVLEHRDHFSSITFMIQKEVASRLQAKHGSKIFSSLSLFFQFYTLVETSFDVSPSCFFPPPKVTSTVVHAKMRTALPFKDSPAPFFHIIRKAFQHRRKMILSSLSNDYSQAILQEALISIGQSIKARPEQLSLEHWVLFYKYIQSHT